MNQLLIIEWLASYIKINVMIGMIIYSYIGITGNSLRIN